MRKLLLILVIGSFLQASAQRIILDRKHLAIVNENGAVRLSSEILHRSYLSNINDRLADVKLNLGAVVLTEQLIYRSLSEVDRGLRDSRSVLDIGQMIAEIFVQGGELLELAGDNPQLLLFAQESCTQLKNRGVKLVSEVSALVLKEKYGLLLDYEKRDALLKKISLELKVIRALIYSIKKCMFWARINGVWRQSNPFSGFINTDKRMVDQILLNYKTLKK